MNARLPVAPVATTGVPTAMASSINSPYPSERCSDA